MTQKGLKIMSKKPNRWIYIVLALLLGGFGVHKIYERMPFKFVIYLVFSFTFIPVVLAFFEAIHAVFSDAFYG